MYKRDLVPELNPGENADYEARIAALENETEQKVSHTISAIESAVESWKAAGRKPEALKVQMVRLQHFYDELVDWERTSLLGREKNDLGARIRRLNRFVEICAEYQKSGGKRSG